LRYWQIAFMAISSTIRSPSHYEMCGINVFGIAEIAKGLFSCAKQSSLQRGQHLDANYLRSLEIDNQFVLGRRLERQIGRLFALEGAIDVADCAPILVEDIRPAGDQAALSGEVPRCVDRGAIDTAAPA
jgi:hypothetical protein